MAIEKTEKVVLEDCHNIHEGNLKVEKKESSKGIEFIMDNAYEYHIYTVTATPKEALQFAKGIIEMLGGAA